MVRKGKNPSRKGLIIQRKKNVKISFFHLEKD